MHHAIIPHSNAMTQLKIKSLTLGAEHDDALRDALRTTLVQLKAIQSDHSWGVGGSQELQTLEVAIDGESVLVESETYIGLSIRGPETLVYRIQTLVEERMQRG